LRLKNIPTQGKLEDIHRIYANNDIPLTKKEYRITEGWMLKPKGMLQVFYKRGWIDEENFPYTQKIQ